MWREKKTHPAGEKPKILVWRESGDFPLVLIGTRHYAEAVELTIKYWNEVFPDNTLESEGVFDKWRSLAQDRIHALPLTQTTRQGHRTEIVKTDNGFGVAFSGNHDPIPATMAQWMKSQQFEFELE